MGSTYTISEHHKDLGVIRLKQDEKDTKLMPCFLADRDPFVATINLKNISIGVIADSSANVHHANEIGTQI